MTDQKARAHINGAFALWWERSTREWSLDLSMLTTAGVTLAPAARFLRPHPHPEQTLRNLHRPS
jgi:hypothetical protein